MNEKAGGSAVRVAIFDLDGTLINTKKLYFECYRRAVAPHVDRAPGTAQLAALKARSELAFVRALVDEAVLSACMEDFYTHYDRLHDSHFRGIYPGVPEMLAELRARGRPLGMVTGKSRRSWEITRTRVDLGPFDALVFEDDVPVAKPDPAGIRLALDRLGISPGDAIYIGDSLTDVLASVAAGVLPAAALWAKRRPEDLESFTASAEAEGALLLRSPADVLPALDGQRSRWSA